MEPFSRFAEYFLEVAAQGNLRRAAERLHVAASAVHRQILMAEDSLGIALFERLPSGMRLTAAGEQLLTDLRRWRKEFAYTRGVFDDLQGLKRGHVSVALISALGEGPFIQALANVCTQYEGVTFDFKVHDSQSISQLLTASEIDVGILLQPYANKNLELLAKLSIPIGVVVTPNHALASHKSVTVSQLQSWRQLVPDAPLMVHAQIAPAYERDRIAKHLLIRCNDVRTIKALALAGVGVGVLSYLDAVSEIQEKKLIFLPLRDNLVKPLTLAVCIAASRQLPKPAKLVVDVLIQALTDLKHHLAI